MEEQSDSERKHPVGGGRRPVRVELRPPCRADRHAVQAMAREFLCEIGGPTPNPWDWPAESETFYLDNLGEAEEGTMEESRGPRVEQCHPLDEPGADVWWERPGRLFPMLITADGADAGFLLLASAPYTDPGVDYEVAALFVRPGLRGRGIRRAAVLAALDRFEGTWLAVPATSDAYAFWARVIGARFREYGPDAQGELFLFANLPANRADHLPPTPYDGDQDETD